MADIEIVVSHRERTTVRVGELFLKIDSDPERLAVEVAAMALAPVPTPEIRWHHPPVLALAALSGQALGRLGTPSRPRQRRGPPPEPRCAHCTTRRCRPGRARPWTTSPADWTTAAPG